MFTNSVHFTFHDSAETSPACPYTPGERVPSDHGVFFTVNGFDGTFKKEKLVNINGVYADFDFKGKVPGLQDLPFEWMHNEPNIINRTKNGYHCIWVLDETIPITDENREEMITMFEGIQRWMVRNWDADNAASNINRLLRLPGHEHRKDPKNPFVVETVHEDGGSYTVAQLTKLFPPVYKEKVEPEYGELTDDAEARIEKMLQKPHIFKLWNNEIPEDKRSESDLALCNHLAFWLAKDPSAMESAWLRSPLGQRSKVQDRSDYRKTAIDKAIAGTTDVYTPSKKQTNKLVEREEYFAHKESMDFSNKEDVARLKQLEARYIANYHKWFAHERPHMLFEVGEDKSYWEYSVEEGIYEPLNFSTVRGIVIQMLIDDGLELKATEHTAKNILAKYRAVNPSKAATFDSFISDDEYFHVQNGWLNTKTRTLESHTPDRWSLFKSRVKYNPDATGKIYNAMLDEQYQLPKDAVRVIDQFSGYILTNNVDQQKMLVFEGRPGCGKSTLPRIWLSVLGEKATTASLASLSNSEVRFMGGNFVNKNFCFFDEANPKTENINEYFMNLADQSTVRVERKGIQGVTTPRHTMKVVLSLNKMPYHQPEGFNRRYRHILFERSFTDEGAEDIQILDKIINDEDELSAVFNRMLDGLDDLRKMGRFTVIANESDRKREHVIAADTMSEFLDTFFEPDNTGEMTFTYQELREAYRDLFPTNFNRNLTTEGFNKEIVNPRLPEFKHIKKVKSNGKRGYSGLRLKPEYRLGQISRGSEETYTIRTKIGFLPDDDY